jgi:peptidoglycan/LPS O-acetylase OafA/YrhL
MKYRREIDGLRALAVIPVILFHAGINLFSGGFIGVDVFFVISGYLITTIILEELEQGKFSVINFYERRARRILPVLFFVMALSIPFAWALLSPFDLNSFSKSLITVPIFLSNIFFWRDGGYFDTSSELKPLLHTWSLAVEEQYYVLFPIFLILTWKLGKKIITSLLIVLAIVSLLVAQWGSTKYPIPTFFLLPTRGFEILIGALISLYINHKSSIISINQSINQSISIVGLILIIYAVFAFDKNTPSPSLHTLIPLLGTSLIILYASPNNLVGKILGGKILVYLGLISYSLYLWHQPILSFSRYYFSSISNILLFAILFFTVSISSFTWYFIERPFRNRNTFSTKLIFISSAIITLFFIIFGYFSYKIFGSTSNFGTESQIAKVLVNANSVYSSNMDDRKFIKYRVEFENLNPNALVLGSSRIMQIGEHNYTGRVLNFGVSGSSIEDDIAIAYIATKKFMPSTLLIAVDPWLFNANSGQTRWKSLNDEYLAALDFINNGNVHNSNYEVGNKNSFLVSLGAKIYSIVNHQQLVPLDDLSESRDKIRKDGSRVYNTTYSNTNAKDIAAGFDGLLNYAMENYVYSKESEEIFSKFLNIYSKKYKVILVLSPYHPDLYLRMVNERPIYLQIESDFREFAKSHNVEIIGSYNPKNIGCSSADFFDGMHPKDVCMGKVIKQLGIIR